ncbi:GTP cyclohydrolase II [Candidatus Saccharibacteria bacterium]|nr:GTP cyclohydrolase II [Candidatus Saccharibacteria bacterium]
MNHSNDSNTPSSKDGVKQPEYIRHKGHLPSLGDVDVYVENVNSAPTCALVYGKLNGKSLVRIHSKCFYGDVLGLEDCDCRDQLQLSMQLIAQEGSGLLIYMDQEGRSLGLANKAKGYQVTQRDGLDTFAAYRHLGLPEDARTYESAINILRYLKLQRIRLLTNNPDKIASLINAGLDVDREPLITDASSHAASYLSAKREKGHLL